MISKRKYSAQFKIEAVRMMRERIDSGQSVGRISRDLGIKPDLLYAWAKQIQTAPEGASPEEIFPGIGHYRQYKPNTVEPRELVPESPEQELKRLRRENDLLRKERDFLKKAAAFFAKESR